MMTVVTIMAVLLLRVASQLRIKPDWIRAVWRGSESKLHVWQSLSKGEMRVTWWHQDHFILKQIRCLQKIRLESEIWKDVGFNKWGTGLKWYLEMLHSATSGGVQWSRNIVYIQDMRQKESKLEWLKWDPKGMDVRKIMNEEQMKAIICRRDAEEKGKIMQPWKYSYK